jgi:hypothetical protein
MKEKLIYFNISQFVKVKLTTFGIEKLKEKHDKIRAVAPGIGEFKIPQTDFNGYSSFQLWELMEDLGEYIGIGKRLPFETNIYFEVIE